MKQLVLDLALPAPEPFSDFVPGDNAELLFQLSEWAEGAAHARFVYLWGESGAGKSHLLAAAAARAKARYCDANRLPDHIASHDYLVVDNVDRLDRDAQIRLFDHYNTLREGTGHLLACGPVPPAQLQLLPDLASRLGWGLVYQLKALSDSDKTAAIQVHARQLGFELLPDQADYLLRHAPRNLAHLYQILDIANEWALSRQKAVTVPLLREILQGL